MMDFEQALVAELSSIAGLSGNIYPVIAKEGLTPPYLVYSMGKNKEYQTHEGYTGLVEPEYQIDLFHSTHGSLKALKKLVIQAIKSFEMRSIGTSGPYIQDVSIMNDLETYEYAVRQHKGIIEFNVSYNEGGN